MLIGAFTILFDEVEWLEHSTAVQLAEFKPVVVVAGTRPHFWVGEGPEPTAPIDKIRSICETYGFDLVVGDYSSPPVGINPISVQRDAGLKRLRQLGAGTAIWVAPDEAYTRADLLRLRDSVSVSPNAVHYVANATTYWYNTDWTVDYWRPIPGLPIDMDLLRFEAQDFDTVQGHEVITDDLRCYHFAFARPEDEMKRKAFQWGHAHPDHSAPWWKAWNEWAPSKSIYWPEQIPRPATQSLPEELQLRLAPILARLRPTP